MLLYWVLPKEFPLYSTSISSYLVMPFSIAPPFEQLLPTHWFSMWSLALFLQIAVTYSWLYTYPYNITFPLSFVYLVIRWLQLWNTSDVYLCMRGLRNHFDRVYVNFSITILLKIVSVAIACLAQLFSEVLIQLFILLVRP